MFHASFSFIVVLCIIADLRAAEKRKLLLSLIRTIRVGDNDTMFLSKGRVAAFGYNAEGDDQRTANTFEKGDEIGTLSVVFFTFFDSSDRVRVSSRYFSVLFFGRVGFLSVLC